MTKISSAKTADGSRHAAGLKFHCWASDLMWYVNPLFQGPRTIDVES